MPDAFSVLDTWDVTEVLPPPEPPDDDLDAVADAFDEAAEQPLDDDGDNVTPIRPPAPGVTLNGFTDWNNALPDDEEPGLHDLLILGVPPERAVQVPAAHADVADAFACAQGFRLLINESGDPLLWKGVETGWTPINHRDGARLVTTAMREGVIVPLVWKKIDDGLAQQLIDAGKAQIDVMKGLVDLDGTPITVWPFVDEKFAASAPQAEAVWRQVCGIQELKVKRDDFDRDPMVLNACGTVVDLNAPEDSEPFRTCPLSRRDLITRSTGTPLPVDQSSEGAPLWKDFIRDASSYRDTTTQKIVYRPDQAKALQVIYGLTLLGDNREQILTILHGKRGNNGKSVCSNTVRKAAGSYAGILPKALLMEKRADAHTTDLTVVRGLRFGQVNEVPRGRWDVETADQLASSEPLIARKMRENNEPWNPTQIIHVTTNNSPLVPADEVAFWKRTWVFPFEQRWSRASDLPAMKRFSIAPQDPQLEARLEAELPGILAWMLEGLRIYYTEGLVMPPSVEAATRAARDGGSLWATFKATNLELTGDPSHAISTDGLFKFWKFYREQNSDFRCAPTNTGELARLLTEQNPDVRLVSSTGGGRSHQPEHLVGIALRASARSLWDVGPKINRNHPPSVVGDLDDECLDAADIPNSVWSTPADGAKR